MFSSGFCFGVKFLRRSRHWVKVLKGMGRVDMKDEIFSK